MNTFKRKSLYAAVLAGLGAVGMAGTASAVYVNTDGLGQALIYPYYTTRATASGGAYNTYVSVVNTTGNTKVVKVRFLESLNSREVLDFNLFLSPYDVWTASVEPTANGAMMLTADKSCTLPAIPAGGKEFVNYGYTGATRADGESASLDRTREGYIEIIEMGDIPAADAIAVTVKHVSGVPVCDATKMTDALVSAAVTTGSGGLSGTATLLNVADGSEFAYNATALAAFLDAGTYTGPGSLIPNLGTVSPKKSTVLFGTAAITDCWDGTALSSLCGTTGTTNETAADPVSAVLMHNAVINEFVLDSATLSGTDWVVTMPTKTAFNGGYVDLDPHPAGVRANSPAVRPFQSNFWLGGSCDTVSLDTYDREEYSTPSDFSPQPVSATNQLCWEANVITFNNSNILGSAHSMNVQTTFQNGWMSLGFAASGVTHTMQSGVGAGYVQHTYTGLPTLGFMAQDYVNGNVNGVLSNYGGNFDHKYARLITAP